MNTAPPPAVLQAATELNMNPQFSRRRLLTTGLAGITGVAIGGLLTHRALANGTDTPAGKATLVWIVTFSAAGVRTGRVQLPKVVKTDKQWQAQLSSEAYDVTRQAGTEPAFSGAYWDLHDSGIFHCVCCDTALFDSTTKFESGTGWPSFYQAFDPEHIRNIRDVSHGMVRTEIRCQRCDGHLGHVFEDGPAPTGLRYCLNSASLGFYADGEQIPQHEGA